MQIQIVYKLIQYSSWPISIIIIAIMFRSRIGRVSKLKLMDYEFEFAEEVKSLKNDLKKGTSYKWENSSTKSLKANMFKLVDRSPLAIVLQAWDVIDDALLDKANDLLNCNSHNVGAAIQKLHENDYLSETHLNMYFRLYALKEKASNFESEPLPKERALELADLILEQKVLMFDEIELNTKLKT